MEKGKIVTSAKFSINWRDILKGLTVSVLTSVLMFVQTSVDAGNLEFHWKQIIMVAVGSMAGYLIKNFFTQSITQTPTK